MRKLRQNYVNPNFGKIPRNSEPRNSGEIIRNSLRNCDGIPFRGIPLRWTP